MRSYEFRLIAEADMGPKATVPCVRNERMSTWPLKKENTMKTIVSTIIAVTIFDGAASAGFDPFNDPSRAVPRSPGYE